MLKSPIDVFHGTAISFAGCAGGVTGSQLSIFDGGRK
jgi:hypothetical protein